MRRPLSTRRNRLAMLAVTALLVSACGGSGASGPTSDTDQTSPPADTGTTVPPPPSGDDDGNDGGGSAISDLPGPGSGDSWFELDGERFEVAHLLRCDMVYGAGDPDPHADDFIAVGVAAGEEATLAVYYYASGRVVEMEYAGGSPVRGFLEFAGLSGQPHSPEEVFLEGNRIRSSPITVEVGGGATETEGVFQFDLEIVSQRHPDCPSEGLATDQTADSWAELDGDRIDFDWVECSPSIIGGMSVVARVDDGPRLTISHNEFEFIVLLTQVEGDGYFELWLYSDDGGASWHDSSGNPQPDPDLTSQGGRLLGSLAGLAGTLSGGSPVPAQLIFDLEEPDCG